MAFCRNIFHCCERNDVEGLRRLIEAGEDVNIQNEYGNTPLHWAARCNTKECLKFLIEMSADVNIQNEYGDTPLHMAAHRNSIECLYLLLEEGLDVNIQDNDGKTFLEYIEDENLKKEIEEYLNELSTAHLKEPDM